MEGGEAVVWMYYMREEKIFNFFQRKENANISLWSPAKPTATF